MTPQAFAKEQRKFLIETEKKTSVLLLSEFARLKQNINQYLTTNLSGRITVNTLFQRDFLNETLKEILRQILLVRNPFTRIVSNGQKNVVNFAFSSLQKFLLNSLFAIDREAMLVFASRLSEKNLSNLFDKMSYFAVAKAKESLINAFASGESHKAIARKIADEVYGISTNRALTIARTETNETFRAASRKFYTTAGIKEFIWMSALDPRTCVICWSLHGRKFKTSKKVFSHPNCRCVLVPKTKNSPEIKTGEELFKKLEKGFQKDILGAKRFELFDSDESLNKFIGVKEENNQTRFFIK